MLRTVSVTRYITPLREGGSLPAITEADDGYMYALKFRGSGQGKKSLIAELIGGEIARLLGFRVPELVFANLDEAYGRTEPDEEIQDLLKASVEINLGLHYLSGAITFDPVVTKIDDRLASEVVWLDAYLMNMDRTPRNTNMLSWNKELWLIDHGAALYVHHAWQVPEQQAVKPFTMIKDHVLLKNASLLKGADADLRKKLNKENISSVLAMIPGDWLEGDSTFVTAEDHRNAYRRFLEARLDHPFINDIRQ